MTQLGKYELHEQLGRGGFGTVYRAIDTSLNREVALKVLHPQLTTDPDFLERFLNEARLVASLKSPNIVTIYELAEADARVFIAMDYLPGGSLKQKIEKEGALRFDKALEIIHQICNGLNVAHKKELVHRDIKPGNILFDVEGNAVLGDFGLARAIQQSSLSAANSTGGVGTPAYRAPELWIGKPPASAATDIYSIGCVLSEMLVGRVLFEGDTTEEILTKHLITGPNLPDEYPEGVPAGLRSVVEKAVAKDANKRYQTLNEFLNSLFDIMYSKSDVIPIGAAISQKQNPEVPPLLGISTETHGQNLEPPNPAFPKIITWILIGGACLIAIFFMIKGIEGKFASKPTATLAFSVAEATATSVVIIEPTGTEVPLAVTDSLTVPYITEVSQKDGMTMVYIPEGDFLMGSQQGVGDSDEYPQHLVFLNSYWIDKTEVTNGMYQKCVSSGVCSTPSSNKSYSRDSYYGNPQYADYPVIFVDWNQAKTYCEWAGRVLPTEMQWEKAARGTYGRIYPWGDIPPSLDLTNFNKNIDDPSAVGSFPAGDSPYRVSDMAGNVWEWVSDTYEKVGPMGSAADTGVYWILKGGSWASTSGEIRSANRIFSDPSTSLDNYGFRCVLLE